MNAKVLCMIFLTAGLHATAQKRPNVIYILTDQWRSSATGYAGNTQVHTPSIDSFAKSAVIFRNCVSVCAKCTPYRAALMTGRYPTTTGMFMNDLYLPGKELCMAEIFRKAGYLTAYYGKWHLDGHGRLNNVAPERRQGFSYWKASECSHAYNKMPYYDNEDPAVKYWSGYSPFAMESDVEKYLEQHAKDSRPFLLFVSFAPPHFSKDRAPEKYLRMYPPSDLELPVNVPAGKFPNIRKELQNYYAHCSATDQAIGDLIRKIKALGLFSHSIIVFTADHGEMMGSHGVRPREKQLAWDEAVKVPFLIRFPGIGRRSGQSTLTPLNTTDILPTLLSLSGIAIPGCIQGKDISAVVRHPEREMDRAVVFMCVYPVAQTHFSEYRAIKTNRYTYVKAPGKAIMMYDNLRDPDEMDNLIGRPEYRPLQDSMERALERQLRAIGDPDFKPYPYYLDKFGFHDLGKDMQEVPYSEVPGQATRVYSPINTVSK